MNENTDFQNMISEHVVLLKLDAEKDGADLAKMHNVSGYPSFILLNGDGDTMDRWLGYGGVEPFGETLTEVTTNPMTVSERVKAFAKEPSAADAEKLAGIRSAEGSYAEAMQFYNRASSLGDKSYVSEKFEAAASGMRSGVFTADDVKTHADAAMASKNIEQADMMQVAMTMFSIGKKNDDMAMATPYMKKAMAATEGSEDESVMSMRAYVMPDYALHIEKDEKKAVKAKKAGMPEGWESNAAQLNSFAWWCFENKVNLKEAKKMAEKGVTLAESGTDKGNVLDTLAEICNLTGDCDEAVELIKQAIAESPDNDYFKEQLARFEKLLAEQERG